MSGLQRDTLVATAVAVVLIVAMAIDHLAGTQNEEGETSGLTDPGAFVLSIVVSLAVMAALFVFVVRRTLDPDAAAKRGAVCSALAIPSVALTFLGLPFPLSAAGVALGLRGWLGTRRVLAGVAVGVGSLVVVAITIGYVVALIT